MSVILWPLWRALSNNGFGDIASLVDPGEGNEWHVVQGKYNMELSGMFSPLSIGAVILVHCSRSGGGRYTSDTGWLSVSLSPGDHDRVMFKMLMNMYYIHAPHLQMSLYICSKVTSRRSVSCIYATRTQPSGTPPMFGCNCESMVQLCIRVTPCLMSSWWHWESDLLVGLKAPGSSGPERELRTPTWVARRDGAQLEMPWLIQPHTCVPRHSGILPRLSRHLSSGGICS